MANLLQFINPTYLFELRPYSQPANLKYSAIFFALMIILGIIVKIYREIKAQEKFQARQLERYFSLLTTMGVLGVALISFRYERVQILAARFWVIVWLLALIIWLYPILKYQIKVAPQAKKQAEERKQLQKYLPKKK